MAVCVSDQRDDAASESPPSSPSAAERTERAESDRRRLRFFVLWGAIALGTVFVFRAVLLPFFLAVVLAYVFAPLITRATRPTASGKSLPRWVAVVLLYITLLGTLGTLIGVGVPRLITEGESLTHDVPRAIADARREWLPRIEAKLRELLGDGVLPIVAPGTDTAELGGADVVTSAARLEPDEAIRVVPDGEGGFDVHLPPSGIVVMQDGDQYVVTSARRAQPDADADLGDGISDSISELSNTLSSHAGSLISAVSGAVRTIVKPVFTFFITLMLSAYILITKDAILGFFRTLVKLDELDRFDTLIRRIDRGLSGVIRGQLLICVVNGVLSGIGFYALGLRYWWLLTIIATVFSIIPIFGSILSTVPAVILGLRSGMTTGLLTLVWILLIHQIEANLLNPKIMGDSAKVHPVLVVFALLAGESLFGIAGALLAVPVLSISQSIFLHNRESALGIEAPRSDLTIS